MFPLEPMSFQVMISRINLEHISWVSSYKVGPQFTEDVVGNSYSPVLLTGVGCQEELPV